MSTTAEGRRLSPQENTVLNYRLKHERFVDPTLAGSAEAFTMAYNAIRWLVMKDPRGFRRLASGLLG
jgi:hypothetical protein